MNLTTQQILRQICNGGPCPESSVRTSAPERMTQTPVELIGQIINPGNPTAAPSTSSAPQQA